MPHNIVMGNAANIWGTKIVSIESAVLAACELFAASAGEIVRAVDGDEFSGQELLALGQAEAVEYDEKHFAGPAMADDEWATL